MGLYLLISFSFLMLGGWRLYFGEDFDTFVGNEFSIISELEASMASEPFPPAYATYTLSRYITPMIGSKVSHGHQ